MADTVGFLTMADAVAQTDAPEIGVGMLGYAFMGKAHANALKKLPYMIYPPPAVPKLAAIAGRCGQPAVYEAPACPSALEILSSKRDSNPPKKHGNMPL